MVGFCKTRVSQELWDEFAALSATDDESARKIGVRINTENCARLLQGGVPGLHFYTLNLEKVLVGTLANLGIYPNGEGTISSGNGSTTTTTTSPVGSPTAAATATTTTTTMMMNGKQIEEVTSEPAPTM